MSNFGLTTATILNVGPPLPNWYSNMVKYNRMNLFKIEWVSFIPYQFLLRPMDESELIQLHWEYIPPWFVKNIDLNTSKN
jgi:hypothetical protein